MPSAKTQHFLPAIRKIKSWSTIPLDNAASHSQLTEKKEDQSASFTEPARLPVLVQYPSYTSEKQYPMSEINIKYGDLWKKGYSAKTPKNRTGIGNSL